MGEQLVGLYQGRPDGSAIDLAELRKLVASDPETVAEVFPVLIQVTRESGANIWGLLLVTAEAYLEVTEDDALRLTLAAAMKEAGIKPPSGRFEPSSEDAPKEQEPKLVILKVALQDLESGSAYRMAKLFAFNDSSKGTLSKLLCHAVLTFPLDHDSRSIWDIPEVRRFMADLHRRIPYFPMFLNFEPRQSMFLTYYGPLCDLNALENRQGRIFVDLAHMSVLQLVRESLTECHSISKRYGLDYGSIADNILQCYEPAARQQLFPSSHQH